MQLEHQTGQFKSKNDGKTYAITRMENDAEVWYLVVDPPHGFDHQCSEPQVYQILGYVPTFKEG